MNDGSEKAKFTIIITITNLKYITIINQTLTNNQNPGASQK